MTKKTVSARIDENIAWELEYLKKALGFKNATDVLVTAVHALYLAQDQTLLIENPIDYLKSIGFVGGAEGGPRDSTNYKKQVAKRVRKKHR